jgi:hypothetical protein
MKLSKLGLLAAAAVAAMTASSASATVLISGLLTWKPSTALTSLSAPGKTLSFSFLADNPGTPHLNTFQADINGLPVAITPTNIVFNATGFVLKFAGPFTLNVKTGQNWMTTFPATPVALMGSTKVNGTGGSSATQVSVLGVASVPEPATWAMMLGGFGLAGLTLRKRSTTKVGYSA